MASMAMGVVTHVRPDRAANLRETRLNREQLIEVIACGRPGTEMPHFDKYAYEDTDCYGLKGKDLGSAALGAASALPFAAHAQQPQRMRRPWRGSGIGGKHRGARPRLGGTGLVPWSNPMPGMVADHQRIWDQTRET